MVMQENLSLMTATEFASMPSDGKKYELVRGVLVEVCRPNLEHGYIAGKLIYYLNSFMEAHPLGVVTTESGFVIARNPDSVRGPDVAFTSHERLQHIDETGFVQSAPDLVVEIVSPNDKQSEIDEKIDEYLAGGTKLVWLFYPKNKGGFVIRPDGDPTPFGVNSVLDGEDVLPGFSLPVRDVFKGLPTLPKVPKKD